MGIVKSILSRAGIIKGDEIAKNNVAFDQFNAKQDKSNAVVHSVLLGNKAKKRDEIQGGINSFVSYNEYKDFLYSPLPTNKISRLNYFRDMSKFPEVSDAIDEIVDNCVNFDDENKCIGIKFTKLGNGILDDSQKTEIYSQFEQYIEMFDFDANGYEYFKKFIVDGELCWENLVDPENTEQGIIGISEIKPEAFELLLSPDFKISGILVNSLINHDLLMKFVTDNSAAASGPGTHQMFSNYIGVGKGLNVYNNNSAGKEMVPMASTQVTYINSGVYNDTNTIVYPILERARRAYNQLQLIEDAIIIYRITRAPTRFVFKIATGHATPTRAEQILQQTMKRYQTKRVYNNATGSIEGAYDPIQMSENFWFQKSAEGEGSEVSSLEGGQQLNTLPDLDYFLRKLYIALKVPFDRFKSPGDGGSSPQYDRFGSEAQISYEEYRFSKFIMKIQTQFAKGIAESFIVHLKFIGLWDQYKMNSAMFKISFVPPTMYDIYMKQKMLTVKIENYDKFVKDHEEFAIEIAQREYLDWTPSMIELNKKAKKKELIEKAYLERIIETVKSKGKMFDDESEKSEMETSIGEAGDLGGSADLGGMGDMGGIETTPPPAGAESDLTGSAPAEVEAPV